MTTHHHPTAPVASSVNDELTVARVPAGHHPSCPAGRGAGPCVGCGPRLSVVSPSLALAAAQGPDRAVVARVTRARLLATAPRISARVLAAEGLL